MPIIANVRRGLVRVIPVEAYCNPTLSFEELKQELLDGGHTAEPTTYDGTDWLTVDWVVRQPNRLTIEASNPTAMAKVGFVTEPPYRGDYEITSRPRGTTERGLVTGVSSEIESQDKRIRAAAAFPLRYRLVTGDSIRHVPQKVWFIGLRDIPAETD